MSPDVSAVVVQDTVENRTRNGRPYLHCQSSFRLMERGTTTIRLDGVQSGDICDAKVGMNVNSVLSVSAKDHVKQMCADYTVDY